MWWIRTLLISCLLWIIWLLFTYQLCPLIIRIFLWCRIIWVDICIMNWSINKFFIVILLLWRCLFFNLCFIVKLSWAPIEVICIIFVLFNFIFTFQSVCTNNSSISLVSFKKISFRSWWSSHLLMFWRRLWFCDYSSTSNFSFCNFLLKKFFKCFLFFNNRNIINPKWIQSCWVRLISLIRIILTIFTIFIILLSKMNFTISSLACNINWILRLIELTIKLIIICLLI